MAWCAFFEAESGFSLPPPVGSPESTQTWTFSQCLPPPRSQPLRTGVIGRIVGLPVRHLQAAGAYRAWFSGSSVNRCCAHVKCLLTARSYVTVRTAKDNGFMSTTLQPAIRGCQTGLKGIPENTHLRECSGLGPVENGRIVELAFKPLNTRFRECLNHPPRKPRNAERRSREFLSPAEVGRLVEAAQGVGRHGHRDATMI